MDLKFGWKVRKAKVLQTVNKIKSILDTMWDQNHSWLGLSLKDFPRPIY